jgi:hypothetical protein
LAEKAMASYKVAMAAWKKKYLNMMHKEATKKRTTTTVGH